jgi:hypothetical protein
LADGHVAESQSQRRTRRQCTWRLRRGCFPYRCHLVLCGPNRQTFPQSAHRCTPTGIAPKILRIVRAVMVALNNVRLLLRYSSEQLEGWGRGCHTIDSRGCNGREVGPHAQCSDRYDRAQPIPSRDPGLGELSRGKHSAPVCNGDHSRFKITQLIMGAVERPAKRWPFYY